MLAIVPPQPVNYAAMSKSELIDIIETQLLAIGHYQYRHVLDSAAKFGSNGNLRNFIYHAREYERLHKPMKDGPYAGLYCWPMKELAAAYGCKPSNAGDQAALLKKSGLCDYEVDRDYITKDGEKITVSYGRLHPELTSTDGLFTLDDEPLTKIGGADNWTPCPICGKRLRNTKTTLVEQTVERCENGHEFVYPPERVAKADMRYLKKDGKYITAQEDEPKTESADSTDTTVGGSHEQECFGNSFTAVETILPAAAESLKNQFGWGNIPAELKAYPQWIVWRWGRQRPGGKREKPPYDAKLIGPRKPCDDTDPASYASFEQAVATWQESQSWKIPYDGIGYCFSANDPFCGIDGDECRDPESGSLNEYAQTKLVSAIQTYWEVSPSRKGVKGIVKAKLARNIDTSELELYSHDHYFTFTGEQLPGTPNTIADGQAEIDALVEQIAPTTPTATPTTPTATPTTPTAATIAADDSDLVARAMAARNGAGEKFSDYWTGTLHRAPRKKDGTPDYSRIDLSLCNYLYFYAGDDEQRLLSLFRQSPYYQKHRTLKWDRSAGQGITYGQKTIRKVIGQGAALPPVDTKPLPETEPAMREAVPS